MILAFSFWLLARNLRYRYKTQNRFLILLDTILGWGMALAISCIGIVILLSSVMSLVINCALVDAR